MLVGGADGWCWWVVLMACSWVVLMGGVDGWCWWVAMRVVLVGGVDGWCR